MLRSEIIESSVFLLKLLEEANVTDALENEDSIPKILHAYSTLRAGIEQAPSSVQTLVRIFQLRPLFDAEWWNVMAKGGEERNRGLRVRMFRQISSVMEDIPKFIELLHQDSKVADASETTKIKLLLPEETGQQSKPQRIVAAIDAISLLYRAMCRLHNAPETGLALTACDSGSDKSFDFTGVPQIISAVKEVIFGIADRVLYFRERQYSERVKCVAESLPVLSQIAEMVESKKMPAEQAELLRRDIISGATKFLETGSTIPEVSDKSRYQVTALLAPTPTLLLEGPGHGEARPPSSGRRGRKIRLRPEPKVSPQEFDEDVGEIDREEGDTRLSSEEAKQLEKLLKKAGRTN